MLTQAEKTRNNQKGLCSCEICIPPSMIWYELNARRSKHIAELISYSEQSHSRISG